MCTQLKSKAIFRIKMQACIHSDAVLNRWVFNSHCNQAVWLSFSGPYPKACSEQLRVSGRTDSCSGTQVFPVSARDAQASPELLFRIRRSGSDRVSTQNCDEARSVAALFSVERARDARSSERSAANWDAPGSRWGVCAGARARLASQRPRRASRSTTLEAKRRAAYDEETLGTLRGGNCSTSGVSARRTVWSLPESLTESTTRASCIVRRRPLCWLDGTGAAGRRPQHNDGVLRSRRACSATTVCCAHAAGASRRSSSPAPTPSWPRGDVAMSARPVTVSSRARPSAAIGCSFMATPSAPR
jgi:hypothetical protein